MNDVMTRFHVRKIDSFKLLKNQVSAALTNFNIYDRVLTKN